MIKCIIFDCDGTLVDSEILYNRALSIKLKQQGIELDAASLVARFRGVKLTAVLSSLEEEFDIKLSDDFIDDYRALVSDLFREKLLPCEGVEPTLAQLEVAMCVATNGPMPKMKLALEVTNLSNYFKDNLFSAYQINSWKPEPDLFLHAAKSMGFMPTECLVVEDSVVGIQAALAAGMRAILYDPHLAHQDIDDVIRIKQFSELLSYL